MFPERESFFKVWQGGYYEGNPLDPYTESSYSRDKVSILYLTYKVCIEPYIHQNTKVMDVGCGQGAWTKCMLKSNDVWALDALPADTNNFYEYVGTRNVKYVVIEDVSNLPLPNDYFDYMFSFGCFCHLSRPTIYEYMKSLYQKMVINCNCFTMISDYDKFNSYYQSIGLIMKCRDKNEDQVPNPGRWYHLGLDWYCQMLFDVGFKIVCPDVQVNFRDPVVHFVKN
jgi:SAM-dependent methyltransferase